MSDIKSDAFTPKSILFVTEHCDSKHNQAELYQYRFKDLFSILAFLNFQNPVRYKSINLLELESKSPSSPIDIYICQSGAYEKINDRHGLFSLILSTVSSTLKTIGYETDEVKAWRLIRLLEDRPDRLGVSQLTGNKLPAWVSERIRPRKVSGRTLYRWLERIDECLERRFDMIGLMKMESKNENSDL